MSRVSNTIGQMGEACVLRDLNRSAALRGWGIAVPLSPSFPCDILDLRPSGPVWVEVKTSRTGRFGGLSDPERDFVRKAQGMGSLVILARVVMGGTLHEPTYSLSYSPIPNSRIRVRAGKRVRSHAVLGPPAEPSTCPDSGLGILRRSGGSGDGTTEGATSSCAPHDEDRDDPPEAGYAETDYDPHGEPEEVCA